MAGTRPAEAERAGGGKNDEAEGRSGKWCIQGQSGYITGTERRRLILLGGWCEATVVMAALVDGCDAHVVVDFCPGLVADAADAGLGREKW